MKTPYTKGLAFLFSLAFPLAGFSVQAPNSKNAKWDFLLQMDFDPAERREASAREKVLISEIMADPLPGRGLPEAEFFELYNAGEGAVLLDGWIWKDAQRESRFEAVTLPAGAYLIVCRPQDTALFSGYGPVAALNPFPSLNNEGDSLRLLRPDRAVEDSVFYQSSWYGSPEKENGGWSLERPAHALPCLPEAYWEASADPAGGTPGRAAMLPERPAIELEHFSVMDSLRLELGFSSFPDTSLALLTGNYTLNNGASLSGAVWGSDRKTVILRLETPLQRGLLYRLGIRSLSDCHGRRAEKELFREFLLPQRAAVGDVAFNEILFNPRQGGADYVEIYNRSGKILDLGNFRLATAPSPDSIAYDIPLSDSSLLFYPGEYKLLSRYPERVKAQYFSPSPGAFLEMQRFPPFPNAGGNCLLLSDGLLIDRLDYTEDMHFELLLNTDGVALEKIHPDLPAHQPGTFQSAAAETGYGTPGYRNSQFRSEDHPLSELSLASPAFSPDGDGRDDELEISYRFRENSLVASLQIFDSSGQPVRKLADNELIGTAGALRWDGKGEGGEELRPGVYVILMEVFSREGWVQGMKKACILYRRR